MLPIFRHEIDGSTVKTMQIFVDLLMAKCICYLPRLAMLKTQVIRHVRAENQALHTIKDAAFCYSGSGVRPASTPRLHCSSSSFAVPRKQFCYEWGMAGAKKVVPGNDGRWVRSQALLLVDRRAGDDGGTQVHSCSEAATAVSVHSAPDPLPRLQNHHIQAAALPCMAGKGQYQGQRQARSILKRQEATKVLMSLLYCQQGRLGVWTKVSETEQKNLVLRQLWHDASLAVCIIMNHKAVDSSGTLTCLLHLTFRPLGT